MEADKNMRALAEAVQQEEWAVMAAAARNLASRSLADVVQEAAALAGRMPTTQQQRAELELRVALHSIWTRHRAGAFEALGLNVMINGQRMLLASTATRTQRVAALLKVKFTKPNTKSAAKVPRQYLGTETSLIGVCVGRSLTSLCEPALAESSRRRGRGLHLRGRGARSAGPAQSQRCPRTSASKKQGETCLATCF